jgi:hypothetical protein
MQVPRTVTPGTAGRVPGARHRLCAGLALFAAGWLLPAAAPAAESLVWNGSFAEPADGGNLDAACASYDGTTVVIVPRAHANEALGGATRWRNTLFAIRGLQGQTPAFRLPLTSPGSGKQILNGDAVSFQSEKLVWSYDPDATQWNEFDTYTRTGTSAATWVVTARNNAAFTQDVVYVSITEHYPVAVFYEWLQTEVLSHPLVGPTASESVPGTFVIGTESGAAASSACSRAIADTLLFGFVIRDPAAQPTQLVLLVSGQHPYEGQNKAALQGAIDWILNSTSDAARSYRAHYVTLVYPFVNPTGELAGLWRGTAYDPTKDVNRHWDTTETVPANARGFDTVIVHKNALKTDIGALGLGEPYAAFDFHQNFGDKPGHPAYVLHSTASTSPSAPIARQREASDYAPFFQRLFALVAIDDMPDDPTGETLRGYMVGRGATLPLTFERSVYSTIARETAFGAAVAESLVVPAAPPPPDGTVVVDDAFTGGGSLSHRTPDGGASNDASWTVQAGAFTVNGAGAVTATNSARAVIDAGVADVDVTSTINLGTDNTGLILRSSDASNYLRFVLNGNGWLLQKTAAGVTTTAASGAGSFAKSQNHTLQVTLSGASIVLTVDGAVVGTCTTTFNQTATAFGLVSSGAGSRSWDSFSVWALAAPPPPPPPPPDGTVVIDDEFSGCGSLNHRAPDSIDQNGGAWSVQAGTISANGGGSAASSNSARAVIDAGVADAVVSSTINLGTDNTGLILRSSDSSNYLRFILNCTGWVLQQTAAGATTTLAKGAGTFAKGQNHALTATLCGTSVTLAVDGTDVGACAVPFNQTATSFGLLSSSAGTRSWDSFTVTQP